MARRRIGWMALAMFFFPWALSLGWMQYTRQGPAAGTSQRENEWNPDETGGDDSQEVPAADQDAAVPRLRRICMERNGTKTYLALEDYLPGVVACQIPEGKEQAYSPEVWKCQAVIARTYLYRLMGSREEILESELDLDYLGDYTWGIFADREAAVARLALAEAAVQDTAGEVMIYDNAYILPLFHEESAGRTRQGDEQFPYLQAVDSDSEGGAGQAQEYTWEAGEFARRIGQIPGAVPVKPDQLAGQIQTVARDGSGYLLSVQIGAKAYSGDEIQAALGLPSSYFSLEAKGGKVQAVVRGHGHGYGLSQNGAEQMAENGWGYQDILLYYFKNISIIFE